LPATSFRSTCSSVFFRPFAITGDRKPNREWDTDQVITEHALLPVIPGREEDFERTFARPVVAAVASVATDLDLLASMPLSPMTAAMVETAVLGSAARFTATLISTDALTLVTAGVVTTYQLADSTLSAAAATLGAGMSADLTIGFWAIKVDGAVASGAGNIVRSSTVAGY